MQKQFLIYKNLKESVISVDLVELLWKNIGADVPTDNIKEFKNTFFNEGVANYEKFLVFFAEQKIDKVTLIDAFQFLEKRKTGTIPTQE